MAKARYISAKEYAERHRLCYSNIRTLLAEHRIPGVKRTGRALLIPADAPLPKFNDKTRYEYEDSEYVAINVYSKTNGVSVQRIIANYQSGSLKEDDIIEVGGRYFVSKTCIIPVDLRFKSGKYVDWRKKYGRQSKGSDGPD